MKYLSLLTSLILTFSCTNQKTTEEATETTSAIQDPLPSWTDSESKNRIIAFVSASTNAESESFVPEKDRIACFDNDGTLWGEQPLYFQLIYAIDQVKVQATDHPEWKDQQPFKAVLEGDIKTALAGGEHAILELVMATHANITSAEFQERVSSWLATAKHPTSGKLYTQMVYQPMLELLYYLRANGYKTFIVSGGGIDFMRVWAEEVYGIPPYQIVGSSQVVTYERINGEPTLIKQPKLDFIDDKEGKPVGIYQNIGRQPIIAVGNSDGDYAMIDWTTSRKDLPSLGIFIHHTDSVHEWSYDRQSHIGRLNMGLDSATVKGWLIIDMANDWNKVWPE